MMKIKIICKIMKKWENLGIRDKLLLMFGMLALISVGLCATVLSVYWSKEKIHTFDAYSDEITKQVSKAVDSSMENIDRLAISMAYSDNIQQTLSVDYGKDYERFAPNQKQAGWYLSNYKSAYDGIQSIYVYDLSGRLFSTPMNFVNVGYKFLKEEWVKEFAESDAQSCIIGPYINRQEKAQTKEIISIARKVKNPENLEDIGYILVNVKIEDILNNNLQKIWEADGGSLLIATDNNHIVFDSGGLFDEMTAMDEEWFDQLREIDNGKFTGLYQGRKARVIFTRCKNSGWYVLRIVEHRQLYSGVREMLLVSALIACLILIGAFFAMLVFSNGFVKPIIRIQKSMLRMTNDNFDPFTELDGRYEEDFRSEGENEISLLVESYNQMSIRLYCLLDAIHRTENEKHKLEIEALSTQINPHFTYNTLGTIKQMALLQNSKGIADLTDAIINLLRATAKYGNGISTLKKELDLLRDYIYIMQMRYYENFECRINTGEGTLEQPMLCMLLQPIVENAIFHGIYGITYQGTVDINAQIKDKKLCITVADNGKGADPEQMQYFLEGAGRKENKTENIGVYNVHKRIQLHYGSEYGLKFERNQPCGTIVTILIPLKEEITYV